MNVNEAIDHAIEKSDEEKCLSLNSKDCKEQQMQLAILLMELKIRRENERLPFKHWRHGIFFETQVGNKKLILFSK